MYIIVLAEDNVSINTIRDEQKLLILVGKFCHVVHADLNNYYKIVTQQLQYAKEKI